MASTSEFGIVGQRPDFYRFHQGEKYCLSTTQNMKND